MKIQNSCGIKNERFKKTKKRIKPEEEDYEKEKYKVKKKNKGIEY